MLIKLVGDALAVLLCLGQSEFDEQGKLSCFVRISFCEFLKEF